MARPNVKGTSFLNLELNKDEEQYLKKTAKDKKLSAKALVRFMIRKYKEENQ